MPNVMAALFNAAVWLTPTTGVPCSNAAMQDAKHVEVSRAFPTSVFQDALYLTLLCGSLALP